MKILAIVLLTALPFGTALADSYSTVERSGTSRNHMTHGDAEKAIMGGKIVSNSVERSIHYLAVVFEGQLFNCVLPWDSNVHCRSETKEPIFEIRN